MTLHDDGMGHFKSLITAGPSADSFTNRFARNLPVGIPDETKITDEQPPEAHGLERTQFGTSQIPDHCVLYVLTDRVTKLEEDTYIALPTITSEIRSEAAHLESRLTNLRRNTDKDFTTQEREIGFLSDVLVDLTRHVVKLEDRLYRIQITLDAQNETLSELCRDHDYMFTRLGVFTRENTQATDRLTRFEAVTTSPVPQPPVNPAPQRLVSAYPRPSPRRSLVIPVIIRWPLLALPKQFTFLVFPRPLVVRTVARTPVFSPWRRT